MYSKLNYTRLSDDDLYERINIDKYAEEEFYQRYKSAVKWYFNKYQLNSPEREDLIQEGMIGLFYAIKTYDRSKGIKFSTYANVCIRNRINNALSAIWNRNKNVDDSQDIEEMPHQTTPERDIMLEEFSENVQKVVLNLNEMEKNVLEKYLDKKTYQEIAKQLDISTKKVDNILMKIKGKLAQKIETPEELDTTSWGRALKDSIHKGLNHDKTEY